MPNLISAKNAKYASDTIQNEAINALAEMVRENIGEKVKEVGYFSILFDETKDISKTETITFVL